jgi:ATP-binding cassette, subfamily B, bacterial
MNSVFRRRIHSRSQLRWKDIRPLLGFSWPKLLALGAASLTAAVAEAGLLSIVVVVAATLSAGGETPVSSIGPLDIASISIGALIFTALVLGVIRTLLQLLAAWLPARISTAVQARFRSNLYGSFSKASWDIQAQEREGHLQEMISSQASNAGRAVLNIATGFAALCGFVALVASALVVNPIVAMLVLVACGGLFLLMRPLIRITRDMARRLTEANLALAAGVSESVRMAEEI